MSREPLRILIVDDDPLFRTTLSLLLEGETRLRIVGFAGNGEEAVQRALLLRPDLVTMDIEMPVMDGVEATKLIRAQLPACRVLLVSASQYEDRAATACEAGAAGYISKSRAPSSIIEAILATASGHEFVLAI